MNQEVDCEEHIIGGPPVGDPSSYRKGFFEGLKRNGDKIKKCSVCDCNMGVSKNQIKQKNSFEEKGIKYKYMCSDCIYKNFSLDEMRISDVAKGIEEKEVEPMNPLSTYLKYTSVLMK